LKKKRSTFIPRGARGRQGDNVGKDNKKKKKQKQRSNRECVSNGGRKKMLKHKSGPPS